MKKAILATLIIAIGCLGLWFFGRTPYRHYQEQRAIEQARKALAKGDYRNASLSARQTLQVNPANLEACQLMADLAEKSHSPSILDFAGRSAVGKSTIPNKPPLRAARPPR